MNTKDKSSNMSTFTFIAAIFWFLIKFTFKGLLINVVLAIQLVVSYPAHFIITLITVLLIYKFFIFLGFNQKRSIKLSSPYLNGKYYLHQLHEEIPDPHNFYHLEPGLLSRPMYCFVCDGNVNGWNSDGLCCDICGYTVHARCVAGATGTSCKTISTFNSLDEALDYANSMTIHHNKIAQPITDCHFNHHAYNHDQPSLHQQQQQQHVQPTQNKHHQAKNFPPINITTITPPRPTHPTRPVLISPIARRTRLSSSSRTRSSERRNNSPFDVNDDDDDNNNTTSFRFNTRRSAITSTSAQQRRGSRTRRSVYTKEDGSDDEDEIGNVLQQRKRTHSKSRIESKNSSEQKEQQYTNNNKTIDDDIKKSQLPAQLDLTKLIPPPPAPISAHVQAHHDPPDYFPTTQQGEFPFIHHWVHGNHSSISDICFLCGSAVGSVFYRYGMHCLWCGLHVHEDCLYAKTQQPTETSSAITTTTTTTTTTTNHHDKNDDNYNTTFDNESTCRFQSLDGIGDINCCNLGVLAKAIIPPHCIYPGDGYTVPLARYEIATKYTHEAIANEKRSRGEVVFPPSSFNTKPKLDFPQLFKFTLPSKCYPLLVIINRKSGGNGGIEKMHDFIECLNPIQVWDLSTHPAELPLTLFKHSGYPFRVLVCGGDGTISSVLHSIDHVFGITPGTTAASLQDNPQQVSINGVDNMMSIVIPTTSANKTNKNKNNKHDNNDLTQNDNLVAPPACAVLPLGTGNDLAQVLGWGGTNPTSNPRQILSNIINGRLAVLDRWDVKVIPNNTLPVDLGPLPPPPLPWLIGDKICRLIQPIADWLKPVFPLFMPIPSRTCDDMTGIMNNYIGFGLDAVIAHQFADLRSSYPRYFTSQMGNKLIYARVGVGQWIYPVIRNGLKQAPYTIKVFVDGIELKNIDHLQGICCLGIKSFGGGICFWGDRHGDENTTETDPTSGGKFKPPALDDGMFELIGFESSFHMGQIQTGQALPHRLAQGRKLEVEIMGKLPLQIDGESWGVRENCRVVVELRTQSLMIVPLHSGPTQSQGDNIGYSPLTQEINITDMLHEVIQSNIRTGSLSPAQSSRLLIDFTKKYTKAAPSSHFYQPSHDLD